MSHRSACSNRLLDYVITSLTMGHSFLDITESILAMNYRAFYRINGNIPTASFYDSPLYSSPGNDKLMQIFLSYYKQIKASITNFFLATRCRILSCDHTFKVSKHIGIIRDSDSAFVNQFQNLYVALNENGEVLTWKLTTSTELKQIDHIILDLKERFSISGDKLDMILVDDCCHVRNFYQCYFPHVPIKLDIFHAVQRVIKTLPKGTVESQKFAKEVGLLFRRDGDVGEERMFATPDPECIESNMEQLLFKWRGKLSVATVNAIENLRHHVRKGCVSEIPPSAGTTLNERLHRHLKRSMLCGASSISPELALPILALVLYVWSCRRRGLQKHVNNQRIVPIIPFEFGDLSERSSTDSLLLKCPDKGRDERSVAKEEESSDKISWYLHHHVENVKDLMNVSVINYALTRVLQMRDCWTFLKEQTSLTFLSMLDLFGLERSFMKLSKQHTVEGETTTGCNRETLERNLASFGLCKIPVPGDGNCCFRSIIKCLHHKYLGNSENDHNDDISRYTDFIKSLGLGINEDKDTLHLRLLVCQEISSKSEEYQQWLGLTAEQLSIDLHSFRQQGWFNSDAGDIAVKVCSNILQIPIVVITSYPQAPYQSFIPPKMSSTHPLYVAFNHSLPGHYDATKDIVPSVVSGEKKKYCQCGKKKMKNQINFQSCTAANSSQQCSCLSSGSMCSRFCQCYNCCNPLNSNSKVTPLSLHERCRCGRGRKKGESNRPSCCDCPGERKSKCPCLKSGISCSRDCQCLDCSNPHNETSKRNVVSACPTNITKKRKRSNPDPYNRKGGTKYMISQGFDVAAGRWNDLETLLLLVVYEVLEISHLHGVSQNIATLYNFVARSSQVAQMELDIIAKRSAQITGKLSYLKGRHNLLDDLMNNK